MKRGVLFVLLSLCATLPVRVAPAAPQAFAVYEITRAQPGGPAELPVLLYGYSEGKAGLMSGMQLAPRKGGGWTTAKFTVLMYNPSDTAFKVYGGGADELPVPCDADKAVCGGEGKEYSVLWQVTFKQARGNRYFVAVPANDGTVFTTQYWRARQVSVGARVVGAEDISGAGAVAAGHKVEVFESATAPSGKYGSGVFAVVPCDDKADSAGTATLKSDGSDKTVTVSCAPGGYDVAFSHTSDGKTWTLKGPVAGEYDWPNRLFVFDYPKR